MTTIFTSTSAEIGAPGYPERTGTRVEVLRALDDDERDPEVGPMFEIRFLADGLRAHAFGDELAEIPAEVL